jgi:hypothetical protein
MFNADTVCKEANDSVNNESAIVQISSSIYCLCVLKEQQRDRRNIKYKQQAETHRQQVIKNHTQKNNIKNIITLIYIYIYITAAK